MSHTRPRLALRPVLDLSALVAEEAPCSPSFRDQLDTAYPMGERRPRPSFRVSTGGSTFSMCNRSQEWNINPQGLRRNSVTHGMEESSELAQGLTRLQCSASDMMEFNVIGRGACSLVRKAIHVPTHRFVALKCISVHEKDKRQQLMNELRLLCEGSTAGVRGVIQYIGTYFSRDTNTINVVLEFMDAGSLETLVARAGPLPDSVLARVAADVLEGLAWLHREKRMIHRDIKPANILLNSSGLPKITDFGISTVLDVGASRAGVGASGSAKGTLCYMSPERLASQPYSFSCDIWSLAVTLLECSQGRYPFHTDQGPVSTMLEIMDCEAPLPVEGSCSPLFRAFLGACLRRDPRERPDALQARRLDWCHSGAAPYPTVAAFLASVFDPHEALQSLAQMFAAHYYRLIDAPPHERFALQGLYRADASFTLAGRIAVRGPEAICAALAALGETSHSPTHLDCQPFEGGGVLVLASGTVIASFETHRFCESFSLLPEEEGHWFLVNHWRQEYK